MIVLGLGSCFITVATLAAVTVLDRIAATRRAVPLRVL